MWDRVAGKPPVEEQRGTIIVPAAGSDPDMKALAEETPTLWIIDRQGILREEADRARLEEQVLRYLDE